MVDTPIYSHQIMAKMMISHGMEWASNDHSQLVGNRQTQGDNVPFEPQVTMGMISSSRLFNYFFTSWEYLQILRYLMGHLLNPVKSGSAASSFAAASSLAFLLAEAETNWISLNMGVSENSVPLNPMVLLIIIPIKWLFHWEYTLFSDKPTSTWAVSSPFLIGVPMLALPLLWAVANLQRRVTPLFRRNPLLHGDLVVLRVVQPRVE